MFHVDVEGLDREAITSLQQERLGTLGLRLAKGPDWQVHFKEEGMSPADLASSDGLESAPSMVKSLLHKHNPVPSVTEPMERVERLIAASGTTGLSVLFGMTREDLQKRLPSQVSRTPSAAGVERGQRARQGCGYGLRIGGPAIDVGFKALDCIMIPAGPGRGDLVAPWMRDHACEVAAKPTLWLMALVKLAKDAETNPKEDWALKTAIPGGQPVSKEFRDQPESEFPEGFRSQNIYETTGTGGPILAASTPHALADDELQLIDEDVALTEVLDPNAMEPVGPGEVGETVTATLCEQASTAVRRRTRDLARPSDNPHDCRPGRRGMRKIGRAIGIGRSDDMPKVNGVIVVPLQIEDVIAGTPCVARDAWQICIDKERATLNSMVVAAEAEPGQTCPHDQIVAELKRSIRAHSGMGAGAECSEDGMLPHCEANAVRVLHRSERG